MCNCGKARASASATNESRISADAGVPAATRPRARAVSPSTVAFEYVGATGLTVFGGATRTRYRFAEPGARVGVDARDAASLDAVPVLRRAEP